MAKNIEFGCPKCDRMFNSLNEMDAHLHEHSKPAPPITPNTVLATPPKEEPVILTYVYKGNCNSCGGAVTTLEIDVLKKHIAIAMCTRCNKQLLTREVAKL
jgi:hypothetical protein